MSSDSPEKSFAALFEEESRGKARTRRPRSGDEMEGVVVQVGKEAVFLDLGAGHQGFVEPADLRAPDGSLRAVIGDKIRVRVSRVSAEGILLVPTVQAAVSAGASVAIEGGTQPDAVKIALGQVVGGEVSRVEAYGIFIQIDGTQGRGGRGLVPTAELAKPRGADLRKAFPLGSKVKAKVIEMAEGKIRLSLRALLDDEERAQFEGFQAGEKAVAAPGFGTLADLLKGRKGG